MIPLMVLWLFFSTPWAWGPIPMTPGWAAVAVLNAEGCQEALERAVSPAVCLGPGQEPRPLAGVRR